MNKSIRRTTLCLAIGVCLAAFVPTQSLAANADGSLVGRSVAGAQVTVKNPQTGFSRTVTADAAGKYRFPFLPVGEYTVQASKDGASLGAAETVTVSLGNSSNANVGDGATLAAVKVVGQRAMIDTTSTESATNITRGDVERLPVQRDAQSVALLAPGVNAGAFGGISFGGSSVAENTTYINGLNVTDFYRRVGFSSIPEEFFEEYQIKTGGYSVEFGRTTGGVINAVTRSGTNDFKFGADLRWEPSFLQTSGEDKVNPDGSKVSYRYDESDRQNLTLRAGGPILRDRLFFYALYEFRDYKSTSVTNDEGQQQRGSAGNDFWGFNVDWNINDRNSLQLLAFSDKNDTDRKDYDFDPLTGRAATSDNTLFTKSGGTNWALTYTGYLTDELSVKAMYGGNERTRAQNSLNDVECARVRDRRPGGGDRGCTSSGLISAGVDQRDAARLDFEWSLGDHLLRFGLDHEINTSDNEQFYPGPDRLLYEIFRTSPGATLANGGVVPAGVTAYVRGRQQEVFGTFETVQSAYYLEDNWTVSPNFVFNAGVRVESFDNKNGEGDTYISIKNQFAPRLGLSWDINGDQQSKLFANAGRYFLPVANVINIKQAGAFLDERTFWVFNGFTPADHNGQPYQQINFGPQIGPVDNSQGDGTVGDLRGEVDADMEQVYQDEFILGFQGRLNSEWTWGVRGIYRDLHNAIDDMEITSNGILCAGEPTAVGYVMGNPGRELTVYTDTNCDGDNDAFVTIDTSRAGWALFDDNGNYTGEIGYSTPKRTYKALELVFDRAWDARWALNASYTLAYSRGNAEGPVNTDTGFSDTGRTEHFDDPFVNMNAYGPLPNDRRHQVKLRGSYAIDDAWTVGATANLQSGTPISGFGVGNPFDGTNYHSLYICVANCTASNPSERVYEISPRGAYGTLPWTYTVNASIAYEHAFGDTELRVSLSVFNLFNSTKVTDVDQDLQTDIGDELNPTFLYGTDYQPPRYAQLRVSLDF